MTTPEILKNLRKQAGETQADIAKLLGFTTTAYQNYERGTNEPSNKSLCILADHYGVTVDYLLGREPQTNPFASLNIPMTEKEVLEKYTQLPEAQRQMVVDAMIQLAEAALRAKSADSDLEVVNPDFVPSREVARTIDNSGGFDTSPKKNLANYNPDDVDPNL